MVESYVMLFTGTTQAKQKGSQTDSNYTEKERQKPTQAAKTERRNKKLGKVVPSLSHIILHPKWGIPHTAWACGGGSCISILGSISGSIASRDSCCREMGNNASYNKRTKEQIN